MTSWLAMVAEANSCECNISAAHQREDIHNATGEEAHKVQLQPEIVTLANDNDAPGNVLIPRLLPQLSQTEARLAKGTILLQNAPVVTCSQGYQ